MREGGEFAYERTVNLAAGKTPCWVGATLLLPLARGQKTTGVAPALNEISFLVSPACLSRFCTKRIKEEGEQGEDSKNYALQLLLLHFLHPESYLRN